MGTLRYNEISMKASHNSYQRTETIIEQIAYHEEAPYNCGCGAIELDISQSDDGEQWSVGHKSSYDKHNRQLSQFLSDLMVWSNTYHSHDVITLYLDLKHTATENFPLRLDEYIKKRFLVDIYSPLALMGQSNNLSEGAKINGWPLLDNLKGKFIICLTGNSKDKKKYATTLPRTRLCFADKDTDPNQIPEDPDRVFFNFHIYHNKRKYWIKVFKECAKKSNVIIRAYVANSEDNWKDCLDSGCNLIATDRISNHKWAKVERYGWDTRFTRLKPLDK